MDKSDWGSFLRTDSAKRYINFENLDLSISNLVEPSKVFNYPLSERMKTLMIKELYENGKITIGKLQIKNLIRYLDESPDEEYSLVNFGPF